MKAIVCKYIGPTNTLSSRIRATAEGVLPLTVNVSGYDNVEQAEHAAAERLCVRQGWSTDLISAGLPDGRTVFVFRPKG